MRRRQLGLVLALEAEEELAVFQASDRCTVRACREREQLGPLLVGEVLENNLPEPLDHLVVRMQRLHVSRHALQGLEVKLLGAAYEVLELLRGVKHLEHRLVEQAEEAPLEGFELLLALPEEEAVDIPVDKFLAILFGYEDLVAVSDQVLGNWFAKGRELDDEGSLKHILQWCFFLIIQNVVETIGKFGVPHPQIVNVWLLVE